MENAYILSFMGIAPMNNPEIVCYIALNNPISYIQYGGTVVAPLVREVLIECINVLDIPKQDDGHKLNVRYYIDKNRYEVPNYIGKLKTQLTLSPFYNIEIIGSGNKIVMQSPSYKEIIEEGSTIYLYTN